MGEKVLIIRLDVILALRKMTLVELSEKIGVHPTNLSIFKNGRGAALKFKTLIALCEVLNCTPGDLLEVRDKEDMTDDLEEYRQKHFLNTKPRQQ